MQSRQNSTRSKVKRVALTTVTAVAFTIVGAVATTQTASAATYPGCEINTSLRHYSRGDQVNCLEKALQAKGYLTAYVNTYFGTATVGAVMRYQRDNNLYVDGIVGRFTGTHLSIWQGTATKQTTTKKPAAKKTTPKKTTTKKSTPKSSTCKISRELRNGLRGADVACYEQYLRSKNYQTKWIDDYFGTYTRDYGTKAAERALGLPVDGIADSTLLSKLGLWSGAKPKKPKGWNGKNGDCGLYPSGDAVLVNRVDMRLWMCRNGKRYGDIMPFTAGPINDAPKGEYRVFFKRSVWWGGNYRLNNFTAFTRGDQGGRVGFHEKVIMNESQVGTEAWRNRSGGCFRLRRADSATIAAFLNYGEIVRILNNG